VTLRMPNNLEVATQLFVDKNKCSVDQTLY
jgi:hypothetical protein